MKKGYLTTIGLLVLTKLSFARTTWDIDNSRRGNRDDASAMSGFYQTANVVNLTADANRWWHLPEVSCN